MQISRNYYLLNPKWSGFPNLRINVSVDLDWTTAIAGTHHVNVTFKLKQVSVQLVDIALHQESAWAALNAPTVPSELVNFVLTHATAPQLTTKNDGTKLDGFTEPTTDE